MSGGVHPMGDRALLIETADPLGMARAIADEFACHRLHGVVDIVPAAATVLVRFEEPADVDVRAISSLSPAPIPPSDPDAVLDVPVVYDGEDLAEVAAHAGIAPDEVAAVHAAGRYTVDFCGFAPGFGYLSGVDSRLHVPRLPSPRARVPAGSVALAAGYTAVYPTASPGGWRLIGRTHLALFDPTREPAALLQPGMTVHFRPVDNLPELMAPPIVEDVIGTPTWLVDDPGPLALVQDLGRPGYGAIAVGTSGAFDRQSLRLANRLVGNKESCAGLEVLGGGLTLQCLRATAIAVMGLAPSVTIDGRPMSAASPIAVRAGQVLRILSPGSGLRTIVAMRGGIQGGRMLNSHARDTLAALGPAPIVRGDVVRLGEPEHDMVVDHAPVPTLDISLTLPIIKGPRADWFTADSWHVLLNDTFTVSPQSDRIGVRLQGPSLTRTASDQHRELAPEGMVQGALQVPPDGKPVILGPDHPVTGGYPVIAVVTTSAVDRLAQAVPGTSVRFTLDR